MLQDFSSVFDHIVEIRHYRIKTRAQLFGCLNAFHTTGPFHDPQKHQKTSGFLFSGGHERDQWYEIG